MGGEPAQPTSYKSAGEMHAFVLSQLDSVVATSTTLDDTMNMITVLGNVSALLFYAYNAVVDPDAKLQHLPVNWVGFYLLNGAQTLALGPFQGRVACTKIKVGRGVCGGAALQGKSLVVHNVHEYPGHIACDGDSNSEIVVVIRAPEDNRVVGVLDIDSTQLGQFNDEDLAFLEKVVAVVAARIKFPFRPPTRPLGDADKPAAVVGNVATTTTSAAVVSVSTPHVAHHLPTDSTAIPSLDVIPPPVVPEVRRVAGWEFQTTQQQRIQTQEEQESMTKNLAVHAIPEIAFPVNALRIVGKGGLLALHFDCFSVLRDAARFYSADHDRYLAHIADDVRIPVGGSWKNSQYSTFDAKIDWAWRHEYFGFDAAAAAIASSSATTSPPPSLQLKESVEAQIDWELLRRTDLPILQYVNIPLFEDDLHDHGLVLCTVKARVMESCFFVLLRHVVHVHGSGTSVRDVRIFHKFNLSSSSSDDVVVVEEQVRRYHVDATTSNDKKNENWSMETVDILAPQVPLVYTKNYYLTAASSTA